MSSNDLRNLLFKLEGELRSLREDVQVRDGKERSQLQTGCATTGHEIDVSVCGHWGTNYPCCTLNSMSGSTQPPSTSGTCLQQLGSKIPKPPPKSLTLQPSKSFPQSHSKHKGVCATQSGIPSKTMSRTTSEDLQSHSRSKIPTRIIVDPKADQMVPAQASSGNKTNGTEDGRLVGNGHQAQERPPLRNERNSRHRRTRVSLAMIDRRKSGSGKRRHKKSDSSISFDIVWESSSSFGSVAGGDGEEGSQHSKSAVNPVFDFNGSSSSEEDAAGSPAVDVIVPPSRLEPNSWKWPLMSEGRNPLYNTLEIEEELENWLYNSEEETKHKSKPDSNSEDCLSNIFDSIAENRKESCMELSVLDRQESLFDWLVPVSEVKQEQVVRIQGVDDVRHREGGSYRGPALRVSQWFSRAQEHSVGPLQCSRHGSDDSDGCLKTVSRMRMFSIGGSSHSSRDNQFFLASDSADGFDGFRDCDDEIGSPESVGAKGVGAFEALLESRRHVLRTQTLFEEVGECGEAGPRLGRSAGVLRYELEEEESLSGDSSVLEWTFESPKATDASVRMCSGGIEGQNDEWEWDGQATVLALPQTNVNEMSVPRLGKESTSVKFSIVQEASDSGTVGCEKVGRTGSYCVTIEDNNPPFGSNVSSRSGRYGPNEDLGWDLSLDDMELQNDRECLEVFDRGNGRASRMQSFGMPSAVNWSSAPSCGVEKMLFYDSEISDFSLNGTLTHVPAEEVFPGCDFGQPNNAFSIYNDEEQSPGWGAFEGESSHGRGPIPLSCLENLEDHTRFYGRTLDEARRVLGRLGPGPSKQDDVEGWDSDDSDSMSLSDLDDINLCCLPRPTVPRVPPLDFSTSLSKLTTHRTSTGMSPLGTPQGRPSSQATSSYQESFSEKSLSVRDWMTSSESCRTLSDKHSSPSSSPGRPVAKPESANRLYDPTTVGKGPLWIPMMECENRGVPRLEPVEEMDFRVDASLPPYPDPEYVSSDDGSKGDGEEQRLERLSGIGRRLEMLGGGSQLWYSPKKRTIRSRLMAHLKPKQKYGELPSHRLSNTERDEATQFCCSPFYCFMRKTKNEEPPRM